jgi:hypothetical protein
MEQSRESLKTAHDNLTKAMAEFARLVLSSDASRTSLPDDLKSLSIAITQPGQMKVFRKNGWCYIYDDAQGVCRQCTAEEDQGTIDLPH